MAPTCFPCINKYDMIKITWKIHCTDSNLINVPRELFNFSDPSNITTKC